MQDTESPPPSASPRDMSPYLASKYNSPISSPSPSPSLPENTDEAKYISDDEISVGCPSPAVHPRSEDRSPNYLIANQACLAENCRCIKEPESEDYFKPLKKLKMVRLSTERRTSPTLEVLPDRSEGVKSFSIEDILNHKPAKSVQNNKIVRPWDLDPEIEAQQSLERFHRHLKAQQLAMLRPEFAFNPSYTSETGSDRSSSVTSDCCSPDIVTSSTIHRQKHPLSKQPGATPLDALFQMTSKTFDSSAGESSAGEWIEYYFFFQCTPRGRPKNFGNCRKVMLFFKLAYYSQVVECN